MALSDYEKQVLEQMEADLRQADPELASQMSRQPPQADDPRGGQHRSPRRVAAGSELALAGLGVVLAGVALGHTVGAILMGVLGFAMMVGGVMLALRTSASPAGREGAAKKPTDRSGGWSHFIADQQRRWEDRGQN